MAVKNGWIKLHRQIQHHWIFKNPEYFRAWVIILMEANHAKTTVLIKSKTFVCNPGESLNSLDTWRVLFGGWSKSKVRRFFLLLKNERMIDTETNTITTHLKVCNYESYQLDRHTNETQEIPQVAHKRNASDTQTRRIKKDKEIKKKEKEIFFPVWLDMETWNSFVEMRKKIKAPLTDKAIHLAIKKLEQLGIQNHKAVLEQSIMNSWKGLFKLNQDNQSTVYQDAKIDRTLSPEELKSKADMAAGRF